MREAETSNADLGCAEVRTRCDSISRLLKDTKKAGAESLGTNIGLLNAAVGPQDGVINPLPQLTQVLEQLQTVETAVRYWTDKGFGARLRRAWDRLWKNAAPHSLEQCSARVQGILNSVQHDRDGGEPTSKSPNATSFGPSRHNAPTVSSDSRPDIAPDPSPATLPTGSPAPRPSSPESPTEASASHLEDNPEIGVSQPARPNFSTGLPRIDDAAPKTQLKDAFLGGFRVFLQKASGVADVIPDPFGKIVKSIADTGIDVMDVLDDVDSNRDEARTLGAHINSLAQAIVQFLPPDGSAVAEADEQLTTTLQSFSRTLVEVFNCLQTLRSQGRFTNMALHEQNRADLLGCGQTVRRAFETLQVKLQLHAMRSLSDHQHERLFDRLGAADSGAQEKGATPEELLCLPGTRGIILDLIYTWIDNPSSSHTMWLNGVAGCGKSTIAATVFHRQEQLARTAAIFYCTSANQTRCATVVPTLAYWLADASHGSLEKAIRQAIAKQPKIANLQLSEQVKLLLAAPLSVVADGAPPTVLIIDALDEWYDFPKASALISLLSKMAAAANVKIIITSRDEKHIRDALPGAGDPSVWRFALDEENLDAVETDIRVYLEHNLRELHQKAGLRQNWPQPAQLDALVRKSDHLFQFAATALRYIRLGYPPDALDALLSNTETSNLQELDALYMTILKNVFKACLNDATAPLLKHVLQCLVCSPVPIGLDVIAYLWSNVPNSEDDFPRLRQSALDHLGSFLVVHEDPSIPIRFLHTSIVDFLTDPDRCTDERFFVDTAHGHAYLATLCLRRLNHDLKQNICGLENYMCTVGEGEADDDENENGDNGDSSAHIVPSRRVTPEEIAAAIRPGLIYASLYWTTHLSAVPTTSTSTNLLSLICEFASVHVLHWIECLAFLGSVLSVGHPAARRAADWCSRVSTDDLSEPTSLFRDTSRFIGLFTDALSFRPLVLYEYLLSSVPTESILRRKYETYTNTRVKVIRGPMQKRWPAHQWTASHGNAVRCIAISPDGAIVASGGEDNMIRLWDAASGMPKGEPLEGHSGRVQSLAFTRDGRYLVSGSNDRTVRIWEVETGQARGNPLTTHTDSVLTVAISPDDTIVASGSHYGTIRFWELESGRQIGEPLSVGAGWVNSVAFTPDGSTVVCGCGDRSIRRWSVKTRKASGEAMMGHTERVWSVCVSPDGKMIASGSEDNSIRLWDAETGEQVGAPLKGHSKDVTSVAFSPDGKTLVSGSNDESIRFWDTRTGKQRGKALTGHTSYVLGVAFSPDGKTVVSGSMDKTVRAWDVEGVEDEGEGHPGMVWLVAFTANGRIVATGSLDRSIMLWSTETGSLLGKVESGYGMGQLQFSADGRALREDAYGISRLGWDGVVREWDVSGAVEGTGAEIRQVDPDETLELPDVGVERLRINSEGWVERDGRKWLWLPEAYGWSALCYLLRTKLVLETRLIPILDVAGLL